MCDIRLSVCLQRGKLAAGAGLEATTFAGNDRAEADVSSGSDSFESSVCMIKFFDAEIKLTKEAYSEKIKNEQITSHPDDTHHGVFNA